MSDANLLSERLTSSELAAVHDAARRRAQRMREEAIAEFVGTRALALIDGGARLLRRLRSWRPMRFLLPPRSGKGGQRQPGPQTV
jgi:hypothetical protein